jgi:Rad3-related DNA helicase
MPEALARAMQVILHFREIEFDLELTFLAPPQSDDFSNWRAWAYAAKAKATKIMEETYIKISGASEPKPTWVKHYTHMKHLVRRLSIIASASAIDWIVEETSEGFQFDPIRPGKYAESAILLRVPHIAVISATVRPKTLYMSGIGKENFTFKEFPSDFNKKDCPIYYVPTQRVDYNHKDLSQLWIRLDQVLARRRDRKGIIHTISYTRRDEVMASSRYADSMLINQRGDPPTSMVDLFRASGPGTILVSPSVGTGYDFPGKDCEFQFICKIPYPPPSKIVSAREEDDKEYRPYIAMQTLVQIFGRGARFKGDRSENIIGDDNMRWFWPRYSHLAPRWFHGFYEERARLPQPLPLL